MRFVCAVPVGWSALLLLCAGGLGAMVVAAPPLRLAIKGLGIAYLLWLAWKLAHSARLAEADAAQLTVGFWQGTALQFVNIKAWLLALTIVAGWVAGRADALQRLAVVLPVMVLFAFASNLAYAATGALLRQWLAQGAACCGSTAAWPWCWRSPPPGWPRHERAPLRPRGPPHRRNPGLALGLLGVVIFALTLPMTRLAVGTPDAPPMSGLFIARMEPRGRRGGAGPVAVGAACALAPARQTGGRWPSRRWAWCLVFRCSLPSPCAMSRRACQRDRGSAALATAAVAHCCTASARRPPSGPAHCWARRWWWRLRCCARAARAWHCTRPTCSCWPPCRARAVGYGYGARLSHHMRADAVICWALRCRCPPRCRWRHCPGHRPCAATAWAAFGYVAVFSMWLGFSPGTRAWRWAAPLRVSQVQLVQPFLGMLFAVPCWASGWMPSA